MADPIFGVSGLQTLPKADPAATNVLDNTPDVNLPDVTEGVDLKTDSLTTWFGKVISELAPAVVSQEEQAELADIAQNGESPEKDAASSQLNASYAVNAFASPFVRLVIVTYITIIILQILKRIPGVSGVPSMSDIADKLFNGKSYDWTDELAVNGVFLLNTTVKTGTTILKEGGSEKTFKYIPSTEIQELVPDKDEYKPYPQVTKIRYLDGHSYKIREEVPMFPTPVINNFSASVRNFRARFKISGSARYYFKFVREKSARLQLGQDVYEIESGSTIPSDGSHPLMLNIDSSAKRIATGRHLDITSKYEQKNSDYSMWLECAGFAKDVPEEYATPFFNEGNDRSLYFFKKGKYNEADNRVELSDRLQLTNLVFNNGSVSYGYDELKLAEDMRWSSLLLSSDSNGVNYYLQDAGNIERFDPKSSTSEVPYGLAYTLNKNNVFFYTKTNDQGVVENPDGLTEDDIDDENYDSFLYVAKILYKGFHRTEEKFPEMINEGEYNSFYADRVEIWGYRYVPTGADGKHIKKLNVYCVTVDDNKHKANGEFSLKSDNNEFVTDGAGRLWETFRDQIIVNANSARDALIAGRSSIDPSLPFDQQLAAYEVDCRFFNIIVGCTYFTALQYRNLNDTTNALWRDALTVKNFMDHIEVYITNNQWTWETAYTKTIEKVEEFLAKYPDIVDYVHDLYANNSGNKTCLITDGQYTASDFGAGNITVRKIENMAIEDFIAKCKNSDGNIDGVDCTWDFDQTFSEETISEPEVINDVVAKFDDDSDYPLNRGETKGADSHIGWLGSYTIKNGNSYIYSSTIKNPFIQFTDGKATVKNKVEMNKAVPDAQPHFFQDAPEMVFEAKDPCTQPQSAMDKKMAMLLENDADQFTVMAAFGCCYTDDLWDKFQELKKLRRHMVRN